MMRVLAAVIAIVELGCLLEPPEPLPPTMTTGGGRLAAGQNHACWIDDQTRLMCWGDNTAHQLGNDAPMPTSLVPFSLGTGWTYVAAYEDQTCGIQDGTVQCWGGGVHQPTAVVLPSFVPTRLDVGYNGSCAFDASDAAYCWGDASLGFTAVPAPLVVAGDSGPWLTVQARLDHACALNAAHELRCWGKNDIMQLGTSTPATEVAISAAVLLPGSYIGLAADIFSGCAIDTSQHLACWGNGEFNNAGATIGEVDNHAWTRVSLTADHACGIVGGTVWCFGQDDNGALGDGFATHTMPQDTMMQAADVVTGVAFSCAAAAGAKPSCWGANNHGQLGNGENVVITVRTPVSFSSSSANAPTSITTGLGHSCVLFGGIPHCWGRNVERQALPMSGAETIDVPMKTEPNVTGSSRITAGQAHTCTLGECWGAPPQIGSTTGPVSPLTAVLHVAAGDLTTCVATDSTTSCFGQRPWMAGTNDAQSVAISTTVMATGIAVGTQVVAVIDNANLYYAGRVCGANPSMLTMASSVGTPELVAAASSTSIDNVASGHICVTSNDGIHCIGSNDSHQISATAPACVPATSPEVISPVAFAWSNTLHALAVARQHTCAISTAGYLYCWGANEEGALGTMSPSGTPMPFDAHIDWKEIATSAHHSCGIATDDQVYCWGINKYGELGSGPHYHSIPTPVSL